MDLGIGLWGNFELIQTGVQDERNFADIKLLGDRKVNDLLTALIPHLQIHSVNELVPNMEQIFIQAVQQFNATHE
jgi:hypothetical protein